MKFLHILRKLFKKRDNAQFFKENEEVDITYQYVVELEEKNLINHDEANSIIDCLKDNQLKDATFFSSPGQIQDSIQKLWDIDLHPDLYFQYMKAVDFIENFKEFSKHLFEKIEIPRYSVKRIEPEWYIGMSNEFIKAIRNNRDKNMQSRILEAMSKICETPMLIIGDTNKPLKGEMQGLWRYRIGDYRVIYKPDITNKHIVLLSFACRGGIYKQ